MLDSFLFISVQEIFKSTIKSMKSTYGPTVSKVIKKKKDEQKMCKRITSNTSTPKV